MRAALLLFIATSVLAQPVRRVAGQQTWILDTGISSYVLGVNDTQHVQLLHWGGRIQRDADVTPARQPRGYAFESPAGLTPEEFPAFGGMRYHEPCLKVTFADGARDADLVFAGDKIAGHSLELTLKETRRELYVTLRYEVILGSGILRKQAVVENREPQTVTLESFQAGVFELPPDEEYRLTYLAGRWGGETQVTREPVRPGKKILESRRGNTSHQLNPWFALDLGGAAGESHGDVWFGALGWSGNWKLVVEQSPNRATRVTGGYNDFDFSWPLKPGEKLESPAFYGGFTSGGFGEASRLLHRFTRANLLPDRADPKPRPVLYNSWEATFFDVTEAEQKALAAKAARLGVELFVVDDGWFGARNNDRAGLGDWYVNQTKFPNGLKPLIDHVHGLGMKFGIWVEPEMVNPDSDLYRAHSDWPIHFPDRPRTEGRNQLILNMARRDVRDHMFQVLDRLLGENSIDFIKWDMNRHFTEPGWPALPAAEQKKLWIEYVRGVYEVFDRLRAKHPAVEIESCSGGGGRVDLEILRRVHQVWTSDNTEAYDRLRIQEGFTFAYPPKVMMDWITDVPNMNRRSTPLRYRFLAAMQGSVGIGGDLNKWTDADMDLAARMVAEYKKVRDTVQHGDLYRLASPREGELTANQYMSAGGRQAVLFAFRDRQQFQRPLPAIRLRGLDESAVYQVRTIDDKLADKRESWSGAWLMRHGLRLRLEGDYDATMVALERASGARP